MRRLDLPKMPSLPQKSTSKNWEIDIRKVLVEPCDLSEDPLGYRALFYLEKEAELNERKKFFIVGASFLRQRAYNLTRAGYHAPMTERAIELVRDHVDGELPMCDVTMEETARGAF